MERIRVQIDVPGKLLEECRKKSENMSNAVTIRRALVFYTALLEARKKQGSIFGLRVRLVEGDKAMNAELLFF
jgi:hypothetical protein